MRMALSPMHTNTRLHTNMHTYTFQCAHLCIVLKELTEDLNSVAADWFELGVQLDIEDGELRGVSGKENASSQVLPKNIVTMVEEWNSHTQGNH